MLPLGNRGGIEPDRTVSPSVRESEGFKTTHSSPLSPATISISVPKSRPGVTGIKEIVFPSFTMATCRPADLKIVVLTGRVNVFTGEGSSRWTSTYPPGLSRPVGIIHVDFGEQRPGGVVDCPGVSHNRSLEFPSGKLIQDQIRMQTRPDLRGIDLREH